MENQQLQDRLNVIEQRIAATEEFKEELRSSTRIPPDVEGAFRARLSDIAVASTTSSYGGRVYNDGSAINMPTGWTSAKLAAGSYRVTHNLGNSHYGVVVQPELVAGTVGGTGNVPLNESSVAQYANYFDFSHNVLGSGYDIGFMFVLSLS